MAVLGQGLQTLKTCGTFLRQPAGERPAQAAAIRTGSLEVCPHHPEGCPRDCMCPKTRIDPATAKASQAGTAHHSDPGAITQPFFSQCTETGVWENPPSAGPVFLGSGADFPVLSGIASALPVLPRPDPAAPFRDPAEKIPLARAA